MTRGIPIKLIDRDALYRLYVKEKKSEAQIQKELGVSQWTAYRSVKAYGFTSSSHYQELISRLSDAQLGWIAGVIDGEGSLGVVKEKKRKKGKMYISYACKLQITATSYSMVSKMREFCGGYIFGKIPATRNRKKAFLYILSGPGLRALLPRVRHLLVVKDRQADIVLRVLQLTGRHLAKGLRKNENRLLELEKLYQEIRELNKRGVSRTLEPIARRNIL
jgi:hypothetical protein